MPDNEEKPKEKSFLEKVQEINEKERQEELKEEARKTKERAEKEQKARESYSKKLNQERIELMKAKQGIIEEDAVQLEPEEKKVYTFKEKAGNFFYHNKLYIFIAIFLIGITSFLIYDFVTKVKPDITVMITKQDDFLMNNTDAVAKVLEQYCSDYNNDGKVKVEVLYTPSYSEDTNSTEIYNNQAYQTRLVAEFQSDQVIMFISDKETCEYLELDDGVSIADVSGIYPSDPNAQKLGYMLSGTKFAEQIGYKDMPDTYFVSFRVPRDNFNINIEKFEKNYENALETWNKYLEANKDSSDDVQAEKQNNYQKRLNQ